MHNLKRSILLGIIVFISVAFARADVIKGRVVDNANHPIPNAEVRVPFQGTGTKAQRMLGTFLHTDSQGFFSADIAPMGNRVFWFIYAVAPGFAEGRLTLKADAKGKTIDIHLQKAKVISGVVVDPQGKPAAGVKVRLQGFTIKSTSAPNFNSTYWLVYSPWADRYQTVTDKTGHWQFKAVPQDSYAQVVFHDPRFVSQEFDVYPGKQYLLHARSGATLTGRVVDETGAPMAKVEVTAQKIAQTIGDDLGAPMANVEVISHKTMQVIGNNENQTTSTTAVDGSYKFTGLSTGFYVVSVYVGNLPLVAAIIKKQHATEGETGKIRDLVLTPGGIITGRVLNEKTGAPYKNTIVVSSTSREPQSLADGISAISAIVDANGYYTLRVPPGTRYVYPADAEDEYIHKNNNVVLFNVQEGQTLTQNFELNPGESLSGVAVDRQGKLVAGVQVMVSQSSTANASKFSGLRFATTDANGRWKVAALVPGSVEISVQNPWYISGSSPITLPHQGEVRITVGNINDLPPVGRVVDIHHKPLKGIIVGLTFERGHSGGGMRKYVSAVSDANGYLHVQPVQFDAPYKLTSAYVDSISNSDYAFVSGGKWNAKTSTFSDIVVDHRDNIVHGRILNK